MTEPITRETSDGFHTFNELYNHRMLLTAALFRELYLQDHGPVTPPQRFDPHRSMLHSDGSVPFGGGWFIVVAQLPAGQISYHYELKHWSLFSDIPERERAAPYDGHTSDEVCYRLERFLTD